MDSDNNRDDELQLGDASSDIDFSRYRTDDLVARLVDLISVPAAIRKILMTAGFAVLLAAIACYLIKELADLTFIPFLVSCGYLLVLAVVAGGVGGILRVLSNAFDHFEEMLLILLEITSAVSEDYDKVQAGESKLPSANELVDQVHHRVLTPALERAAETTFGFFKRPILWVYERSLGKAIQLLIKQVAQQRSKKSTEELDEQVEQTYADVAQRNVAIQEYLTRAVEIVGSIGGRIRSYALRPTFVIYVFSMLCALIPVILLVVF